MKDFLLQFPPFMLVLLVIVLGTAATGIIAAARAPHEYTACREMAHGNIQSYNECVRAEHGNR